MKQKLRNWLALVSLLALGEPALAQIVPDITPIVETVTERQVERVQNEAAERALERTEAQQAENVQNQALEQVQNQVERAQEQAAEQAQTQIERVQNQVEHAQNQIEQVQSQLESLPDQAVERLQDNVSDLVPGIAAQIGDEDIVDDAASNAVAAAVPDEVPVQIPAPQRRVVTTADGTPLFVEITLEPGVRAVEFEWVMLVTPEQRQQLDDEAAELLSFLTDTEPFALTEGELLTFRVSPDLDANDAILQLVPENLRDLIDRNHIYDTQQGEDSSGTSTADPATLLPLPMAAVCENPVALGMIDSAINSAHPAFARANGALLIQHRSFVDPALAQPGSHGTAVAGLLVGNAGTTLHPLLPAATLYGAAVFHEQEGVQQGATLMHILEALDWLVGMEEIRVINMSLAGPPNRLLAQTVTAATAKGKVIVAAVGNDGPYGPVRYPAAYDEAIGVTAVTRNSDIYRFANQGPHIDFAALGVDLPTARNDGSIGPESGTSLAAPVVAAFLACELTQHDDLASALAALNQRAQDLGEPGRDPVYGYGLLHP